MQKQLGDLFLGVLPSREGSRLQCKNAVEFGFRSGAVVADDQDRLTCRCQIL